MKRLDRIQQSTNYKQGSFQNLSKTPVMAEGVTYFKVIRESLKKPEDIRPTGPLPSVKTDLKSLSSDKPVIVWFGHSSYFIRFNGVNILVDPVFSGHASPFSFMIKAFPGSDIYTTDDLPAIDFLILTHNHYDHLDTKTIVKLKDKIKAYYAPLGVGEMLEKCNIAHSNVQEFDWWETENIMDGIQLTAAPARHFSGRGLKRGGSLWASFILNIFGYNIYIGGDSGYDTHFKEIGDRYGPFDIVILECGQYNLHWPHIHMMPRSGAGKH